MAVNTFQYSHCPLLWIFYGKVLDKTLSISEWKYTMINPSKQISFLYSKLIYINKVVW